MKTRDRILQASLQLFNECGEPRITTNHIADELDISPGNLYYHFRNKDEIIALLFQQFEKRMETALQAPQRRVPNMEDMWLYLHLVFENIWEYRFLYHDLDNILGRNRKLRTHFRRILERKVATAATICQGLADAGIMTATAEEIAALAQNIAVVATYWLNFQGIRASGSTQDSDSAHLALGVYQVLSLVAPFLNGEAQELLRQLSREYLS
ncbi:MAG TPA: TetR/AcrR family transcriptional regulator [Candidatus Competibacteraceae bacterium]|nr:MAG: TetR/AcrR family transcriptional regulator [Candidatus Competibacteraceae bacterium]HOB60750.1 TetR/AcrR family transcriptional regulator [Candidatus Competibacteraceae bacterium]HQA24881.1 TetR/AcrR family transcriptional regulator [Candidatus Competibacteraceae bacterium]HQD55739.1 TetR/AcrR family transcriptional regulator [Candidatus Competibacteraceae bacterium]